jgi:hypothetical protein
VSPFRRPELRLELAVSLGALLLAVSACSTQFDTDNLSGDASNGSGSTLDGGGGGDDGGGEGDGSPGGGDAGGGGNPDGGNPPPPDGGNPPPPDAGGGGDCGDEGEACCPPMGVDSCNDDFLECSGGTCQPCGNALGADCCQTAPECSGLLGLTCGLLDVCTGL